MFDGISFGTLVLLLLNCLVGLIAMMCFKITEVIVWMKRLTIIFSYGSKI